jgi:S1-C subfamily serine protease
VRKFIPIAFVSLLFVASVAAQSAPLKRKPSAESDQETYKITAHIVAYDDITKSQLDNYTVVRGSEVLKVQYAESQISTLKPGASPLEQLAPGKDLHFHSRYREWPQEPDVSQVPQVGVPIRACEMDTKYPDKDGHPAIAIQSVPAPCMSRNGNTLHYALAPNGGVKMWEYVNFDILEETNNAGGAAAQPAPTKKDIPTIVKAAKGAIVTIVTAEDDKPLARGTGFLLQADGVIVTNYHVIANGNVAVVKFADDSVFPVDGVLAADKGRDLAVIKIHGKSFRTLVLGNSDGVQIGDEVVAIGNPLGLELTVSNGILSGVRTVDAEKGKFLQVTAPISHGSSGGPLFNMAGEVVGITSGFLEGGENLNFAIPSNDVKRLIGALLSAKLQPLPNEPEPTKVQNHESDAPPSASTTASIPDLKTTAEFMGRMVEPEHRHILLGELQGAKLHSRTGRSLTIVSDHAMLLVAPTGENQKKGYPETTYSIMSDGDGKREQKDYPRYTSFSLGVIDPTSIKSKTFGYDIYVLSEFWDKHPKCEANPECSREYYRFLDSTPKMTVVQFHTTDRKPLIERGGCTLETGDCALSETANDVLIFFKDKDRAERFVTALIYAVKLEGGKPDLFAPTVSK